MEKYTAVTPAKGFELFMNTVSVLNTVNQIREPMYIMSTYIYEST